MALRTSRLLPLIASRFSFSSARYSSYDLVLSSGSAGAASSAVVVPSGPLLNAGSPAPVSGVKPGSSLASAWAMASPAFSSCHSPSPVASPQPCAACFSCSAMPEWSRRSSRAVRVPLYSPRPRPPRVPRPRPLSRWSRGSDDMSAMAFVGLLAERTYPSCGLSDGLDEGRHRAARHGCSESQLCSECISMWLSFPNSRATRDGSSL